MLYQNCQTLSESADKNCFHVEVILTHFLVSHFIIFSFIIIVIIMIIIINYYCRNTAFKYQRVFFEIQISNCQFGS